MTQFYAGELLQAVEHLHRLGVVYVLKELLKNYISSLKFKPILKLLFGSETSFTIIFGWFSHTLEGEKFF